jgi:hypothetical protein
MSRPSSPPEAIFWAHVDVDGPFSEILGTKCWMWTGTAKGGGSGQFDISAATVEAYRKCFCALASRSVRRVAAKLHAANLNHLFDATEAVDTLREIENNDKKEYDR